MFECELLEGERVFGYELDRVPGGGDSVVKLCGAAM